MLRSSGSFDSELEDPLRKLSTTTRPLPSPSSSLMASSAAVAEDGLSIQNVATLDPSKLTPLTQDVISRQVRF